MAEKKNIIAMINDTPDRTNSMDSADIEKNKIMAILPYLWILFIIPLFLAKDSKYAKFHLNQGVVLSLASLLLSIISGILTSVLAILGVIFWIISVILFIFQILGIVYALQGKAKELPFIGGITIFK